MPQTLKKQALTLTIANGFTRGLGFLFRLMTARLMGAEAIGVMELSASAAMLALTPATAGLPTAMSRMTARPNADQHAVLRAGLSLNRRIALVMMPLLFLLAPGMAWLLSDFRTLPAILISIPAVFLLGCCAVYSGWFYGRGDMLTPAQCECSEQIVRFVGSLVLLLIFTQSPLSVRAALPGFAGILAGICVWMMFRRRAPLPPGVPSADLRRELLALSAPTAVSRLCQTCLRMLTAVLLPLCLRQSGLTASAATAQFGLLSGMAMPLIMAPGVITSAMCMVAAPAVSRQESNRVRLKRTMRQLLLMAGLIGCLSSCVLFLFAQPISMLLYGEPALTGVLMALSPAVDAVCYPAGAVRAGDWLGRSAARDAGYHCFLRADAGGDEYLLSDAERADFRRGAGDAGRQPCARDLERRRAAISEAGGVIPWDSGSSSARRRFCPSRAECRRSTQAPSPCHPPGASHPPDSGAHPPA